MTRPSLHTCFLQIAAVMATRGTCLRAKVGCVLSRGNRLLVTGYVGSRPGEPHCLDEGCVIGETGGCVRTQHAEMNALQWARDLGVDVRGSTAYVTLSPCLQCASELVASGVVAIYYLTEYRKAEHLETYRKIGITVAQISI